jgi:hypothetical protein
MSVHLWSRNEKDFGRPYPRIVEALANRPDNIIMRAPLCSLVLYAAHDASPTVTIAVR